MAEAKLVCGFEKEELRVGTEEGRPPVRVVVLKDCILEAQGELAEPPRLEGMVCW